MASSNDVFCSQHEFLRVKNARAPTDYYPVFFLTGFSSV